jgi:anti-sigma-K factor RskA
MEPSEAHTLTGAYAADALDDLDRAAFERHLATCADCAEEVRSLRETVARLADGVAVPPPARLRERVLAEVAVTAQAGPRLPARNAATGRGGRRVPWLVAASVAAAVSLGAGSVAWWQHEEAEDARTLARQVAAVVADPGATRVTGTVAGGGSATLVVAGSRAVVLTAGLPGLPEDRVYQLWIVRSAAVSSAGLGPGAGEASGSWARLVDGIRPGDAVAVSIEPEGGSRQPTTTPVVALQG